MRIPKLPAVLLLVAAACAAPADDAREDAPADAAPESAPAAVADTGALNAAVRAAIEADGMDAVTTPFRSETIDLDADGTPDGLALVLGPYCGTGGCTLMVLKGGADGYRLDSSISLVRGPIVVADATTAGWRDIVLVVSGGGMPAKTVVLHRGADGYPGNPSMLAADPAGTADGQVVFPAGANDLGAFAHVVGRTPQEADLWSQAFLSDRLRDLLYGPNFDDFVARMQTVGPISEENGVYYVTGNMDNAGGSDAAILVADPAHNALRAWIWVNGELREFSEAPVTIDLPADVETILANMAG